MNDRLKQQLEAIAKDTASYGRGLPQEGVKSRAAVLALFRGTTFEESEVLLILRSKHLAVHAGEVAFPGGGMEIIDMANPVRTALRECFEEVGIPEHAVKTLGVLPMLSTLSGKACVDPVLALYDESPNVPLVLDGHEVDLAEWVSVKQLRKSRETEVRKFDGAEIHFPYFQWGNEKMWGLTAMIFDLILQRYDRLFS